MIIRGTRKELEQKAAWLIADQITEMLKDQPTVVLALPGGRSVSGIFQRLREELVPWDKVHIFMVDERLVPLTDKESNFLLVQEFLADALPKENLHPFMYDESLPDKGTKAYQEELDKYGGVFDIVLVSSGEDGHIAGLYPNHHSIANTESSFITMDDSPKPPSNRMSASRALLEESTLGIVLFFGESKKDALQHFFDNNFLVRQCPAKLISSLPAYMVLTDQGLEHSEE